jgi:hypothetical protein
VAYVLQAHHLDLEFYEAFYKPGAYLRTHAEHMQRWHPGQGVICGRKGCRPRLRPCREHCSGPIRA